MASYGSLLDGLKINNGDVASGERRGASKRKEREMEMKMGDRWAAAAGGRIGKGEARREREREGSVFAGDIKVGKISLCKITLFSPYL